jgi:putative ABC transport system permease protein
MIRNYLKIAWRNLFRNRLLTVINLIGLAVSVTFCLLLVFHIRYEQSFDSFHQKKDRLYRCEMTSFFIAPKDTVKKGFWSMLTKDNEERRQLSFPLIAGPDVQAAFPEVASYTRLMNTSSTLVRVDKEVYKEKECLYTDDNFFLNFSFPLEKGDAKTALASPGNVVLAASTAIKYFGDKDPIGQTISLVDDSDRLFKVTGVAADAPANSSIQYTMVFPIRSRPEYQEYINERFNHLNCNLILELRPGTDAAAFDRKLTIWARDYMGDVVRNDRFAGEDALSRFNWYLRPLADCHYSVSPSWWHYTDAKAIYQLGCIVAVILLLASLNNVLITVSNASARSQEIGVRKVMGARRWNVILQFWIETQLLVGFAVVLGLALAEAGVPLLRSTIGSGLTYASLSWKEVLVAALVLALWWGCWRDTIRPC